MLNLPRILRPLLTGIAAIPGAGIARFECLAANAAGIGFDGAQGAQGSSGFDGGDSKRNPAEAGRCG